MLWSPARLTGGRQRHRKDDPKTMTGAMYAAIGGLKSHMSKLNVIGNNVANVNTYGYKAQRMTFKESIYTTSKSGSNGGVTSGGNNPSQIGYGCSVGSIDLNMSPPPTPPRAAVWTSIWTARVSSYSATRKAASWTALI